MARPVDLEKRAQLAVQAFEVLRARGVAATTMSDLAGELGLKRPTLHYYFRDLGEVYEAVLDENQKRLRALAAERLLGVEHPLDLLLGVVRVLHEHYRGRRDVAILIGQLMAARGSADPEEIVRRGRAFVAPIREALVERLQAGIEAGLVRECNPPEVVDLAIAACDGALLGRIMRDEDAEPVLVAIEHLVIDPLRTTPKRRSPR